jgi:hypothetical protein
MAVPEIFPGRIMRAERRPSREKPGVTASSFSHQRRTKVRPAIRPIFTLPPIEYAGHLETREIEHDGVTRWKNGRIFREERRYAPGMTRSRAMK